MKIIGVVLIVGLVTLSKAANTPESKDCLHSVTASCASGDTALGK